MRTSCLLKARRFHSKSLCSFLMKDETRLSRAEEPARPILQATVVWKEKALWVVCAFPWAAKCQLGSLHGSHPLSLSSGGPKSESRCWPGHAPSVESREGSGPDLVPVAGNLRHSSVFIDGRLLPVSLHALFPLCESVSAPTFPCFTRTPVMLDSGPP